MRGNERLRRYYEEAGYRLVGYKDYPEISCALGLSGLVTSRLGRATAGRAAADPAVLALADRVLATGP